MGQSERDKPEKLSVLEAEYVRDRFEHNIYELRPQYLVDEQEEIRDVLKRLAGARHFGSRCFIARGAKVYTNRFSIGDNSWIAAGALVRGDVALGDNCSVNPYAHLSGVVRVGNGVRIGTLASIMGFNHGFARIDVPIREQKSSFKGVTIGDECWVGSNAVVLDGVFIGRESIIAAGAIVTKSFPAFSIIAGNPGRLVRSRKDMAG